ncbi:MAG TPA: glucose 1-dehydrogenase [Bacteroidia bacterium]
MNQLQNKVALITGAGSGMGRAMSILFASQGANVVASDVNRETLDAVVGEIKAKGGVAISVVANVAKEDDVKRIVNEAITAYGSLDILVNNAGILDDFIPVAEASTELWNRIMGVNINGPFFLCRETVPLMLKKGKGTIINIASIGGFCGARAGVSYTTSKHALIGLTKNIGFMYAKNGIRCNAIAPGSVNTNIGKGMRPNIFGYEKVSSGLNTSPRNGEPSEIAELALFLASEKSSFINGAVLTADGGWTAY